MKVTHCAVLLAAEPPGGNDRLLAFARVVFDGCFAVDDLRVIAGASGPFVAMPSRKVADPCPRCGRKNHLRSRYCNECGGRLDQDRATPDDRGRAKLHDDIAHPINAGFRDHVHRAVLAAYRDELARSALPGYVPSYDDWKTDRPVPTPPPEPSIRGRLDRIRGAAAEARASP